jgi:outer membrane biosynthesis protein TonB
MKQETNNEMDLLLRRLSRGASNVGADGNHLDADELSSYAENALPAVARARYTEHLAECASCRKLVAQLSSSVSAVSAAAKVSAPSTLRKFLASLFSPMVLRYAVPALGLIVVAAIGLTVIWRERRATSLAQLREQEPRTVSTAPPEQSPSPGAFDERQEKAGAIAGKPETRAERSKETQPAPPPNAPPSVSVNGEVNQAAPTTKPEQQPVANEPPAPKPTPAIDETKKSVDTEAKIRDRVASEPAKEKAYQDTKGEDRRSDEVAAVRAAPASAAAKTEGTGSLAKLRRADEKDKNDADTRLVAGRRFRRERGVWIDTAYDSSRSTVSLTRSAEQYRALIADEPAIKTIAEQLDGEIIVVWKGRAYHIR